jgi:transposase-like protein
MKIDALRQRFPDEESCRAFFESVLWPDGPVCPHCHGKKAWGLRGQRPGLHECAGCGKQFTLTTKTPFHATKLSLWVWLQAMYYLCYSSKGVSSVYLARWLGLSQKSAWKILHALRAVLHIHQCALPALKGVVEVDEKFLGGKPRHQEGVKHKRGRGTRKSCILVAVERHGSARAVPVANDSVATLEPLIKQMVSPEAVLMSDELSAYRHIGRQFASHHSVNHGQKEFARGDVHNNTAEAFNALLERAKLGVYHYMSKQHLVRYVAEVVFRWNQRVATEKTVGANNQNQTIKIVMKPLPLMQQLRNLLGVAQGCQVRRTANSGIRLLPGAVPLFGL